MSYPIGFNGFYGSRVNGYGFLFIEVLGRCKHEALGTLGHVNENVVANHKVEVSMADSHCILAYDFVVLVKEHSAYTAVVHAGPTNLTHTIHVYGMDIHIWADNGGIFTADLTISHINSGKRSNKAILELLAVSADSAVLIDCTGTHGFVVKSRKEGVLLLVLKVVDTLEVCLRQVLHDVEAFTTQV